MKTLQTEDIIEDGYRAMIWLDESRNLRVYLDLDAGEARWLGSIADRLGLTIEEFLQKRQRDELPKPAYPKRQLDERTTAELSGFSIQCAVGGVWQQIEAIARFSKKTPNQVCAEAILGTLECYNEDVLWDTEGEIICESDDVSDLGYRTDSTEPPPIFKGRMVRGSTLHEFIKADAEARS